MLKIRNITVVFFLSRG